MSFFSSNEKHLGIDIGSAGVKIVELRKAGGKNFLSTYGLADFKDLSKGDWRDDIKFTAQVISKVLADSGATSKSAIAALPSFAVFSSVLTLNKVPQKELEAQIRRQAAEITPMPIDEMALDWKEIKGEKNQNKTNLKFLITAASKKLVESYVELFKEAGIKLLSLETESFSLVRSLLGNDKSDVMIVEIGASTSDVLIISGGMPILSRSINFGGRDITKALASSFSSPEEAERFKCDLRGAGVDSVLPENIKESLNQVVTAMRYVFSSFASRSGRKPEKIILSGGSSLLPGLSEYFAGIFNLNTVVGDPWARIGYPSELKPALEEAGPRLAVAVGLAQRGKE